MKNFQLGIKLWSSNENSFPKCLELLEKNIFDYVEMYVVPGQKLVNELKKFNSHEVILHGPSYNHSFNIIDKNKNYFKGLKSVLEISNMVESKKVIFHPGIINNETIPDPLSLTILHVEEIQAMGIEVILENVPHIGIDGKTKLVAAEFNEFKLLKKKTDAQTCIDVAHTIASANIFKENPLHYFEKFLELNPMMIHLCDGDYNSTIDRHLGFNKGNFPLVEIIKRIPDKIKISLETPKEDFVNLSSDIQNLNIFKETIGSL